MTSYTFIKNETHCVIHINDLCDDLKSRIKDNLSKICHGSSKSETTRATYSYKETIKEFLKRYNEKPINTKKGMIGELLTHLFISEVNPDFNTVSPYFNLEERSIKKGFDLILYSQENNDLWITEVKSGELHKNKNSNQTNKVLLDKAKEDLKERLNESNSTLWANAINGAMVALDNNRDMKKAVEEILGDISDTTVYNTQTSKDKNVVLVSSLFSPLTDKILGDSVAQCHENYCKEDIFNNILIISIQKETYIKIIDFLNLEGKA